MCHAIYDKSDQRAQFMTMGARMKNKKNHIAFILYFLLVTVIPYAHCHASEGLIEKAHCKTSCCELRDHNHAGGHHVDFLIGDHAAAAKNLREKISPTPKTVLLAVNAGFDVVISTRIASLSGATHKPQEGHFFSHSGLSPPLI